MAHPLILLIATAAISFAGQAGEKGHRYRVGEVDKKGNLVIYVVHGNPKHDIPDSPFLLQEPYGTMLFNEGEKQPKPRYVLASRAKKTVFSTYNFNEFKKALAKLPRGSKIRHYDSCTVSQSYGLKQSTIDAYEALPKQLKLKVVSEPNITCVCESMG